MRLDKFISKSTELTSEQVSDVLHQQRVLVNGIVITNGAVQVHENNNIVLNEQRLVARPFRYLMFHKPVNTLCSNVDEKYPSIFNFIDCDKKSELHIVGRLDADTTGLLLITDNGRWSFTITSPKNCCEKTYRVTLKNNINAEQISALEAGLLLQGEKQLTRPAKINVIFDKEVLLTITEGKYHQVKRMFAAVHNKVIALHRESIGAITLDLPLGQWRYLTTEEIADYLT